MIRAILNGFYWIFAGPDIPEIDRMKAEYQAAQLAYRKAKQSGARRDQGETYSRLHRAKHALLRLELAAKQAPAKLTRMGVGSRG